jgi:hypothetical protein
MYFATRSSGPTKVATFIVFPAIIAGCWIAWSEITLDPPLSTPDPASTLTREILANDVERAFSHIRAGQDPNAPVPFRDRELTGDRELMVTPLMIAVAHRRSDSVAMLVSSGARVDAPGNRYLRCVAWHVDYDGLRTRAASDGTDTTCPQVAPSEKGWLRHFVE